MTDETMGQAMEGGCQCGRVRYRARLASQDAYLCHCRMCQRATGNVSIAFVSLPKARIQWLSDPDWYRSSPIARRPFCRECGTPLGFAYDVGDNADLTVGSFDDPGGFVPKHHFGAEALYEEWIDTHDLPRHRVDEHAPIVERWAAAGTRVPE